MNVFRILLFVLPCNVVFAACPTNIRSYTKEFDVIIYQDCGVRSEIVVTKSESVRQNANNKGEYQRAFLDTECKFSNDESILTCRNSGRTILSGSTYKLTNDGPPECKGDTTPSQRYTRIKGSKASPRYLDIDSYEGGCDNP